MSISFTEL